ncbi:hypothetical protein NDU88_001384 [Pleurodeles waltl]|uniref:Uncharacterized protein n=1 Tax=Pleurodeles waltl TaxID=8319 RepID=A0AAV7SZR2_PLEWA|nr:hypothetical protein NDU88_001384 [Pleurodeles waltl]
MELHFRTPHAADRLHRLQWLPLPLARSHVIYLTRAVRLPILDTNRIADVYPNTKNISHRKAPRVAVSLLFLRLSRLEVRGRGGRVRPVPRPLVGSCPTVSQSARSWAVRLFFPGEQGDEELWGYRKLV